MSTSSPANFCRDVALATAGFLGSLLAISSLAAHPISRGHLSLGLTWIGIVGLSIILSKEQSTVAALAAAGVAWRALLSGVLHGSLIVLLVGLVAGCVFVGLLVYQARTGKTSGAYDTQLRSKTLANWVLTFVIVVAVVVSLLWLQKLLMKLLAVSSL